jgi:hypothetical protein
MFKRPRLQPVSAEEERAMLVQRLPLLLAAILLAACLAVDSSSPVPAQDKANDKNADKKEPSKETLELLDKSLPKLPDVDSTPRGDSPSANGMPAGGSIRFIRFKHPDESWDKNFGSGGDANLLSQLKTRMPKIRVANKSEYVDGAELAKFPLLKSPPLVFIGGAHGFKPSAADKRALRQYLNRQHGMILGDNLGGKEFHDNFVAVMNELTGTTPIQVPRDDRIHQRPCALPKIPFVVAHGGKVPLGWKVDGRWVVYYHPGALSDAWRDDRAGVKKEVAELCFQLGINVIYYAHLEYGRWLRSQTDADVAKPPAKKEIEPEPKKATPKKNPFDQKNDDLLKDLKK